MMSMDEKLSAYLDDMLPEEERAALEALLAADPALAGRLEALALANADFAAQAAEIDGLEMSDGLKRQLASLAGASAGDGNVVAFRFRDSLADRLTQHRALAACAAVAAGLLVWQTVMPEAEPGSGPDGAGFIYADTGIGRMLTLSPSGEAVPLSEDAAGQVRFSFAAQDGAYCRLADLTEAGATSRLVACREGEGWRVMIAVYTGQADGTGPDIYRTASTEAARSVETVLDTLMAEAPLGPEQEADIIRARWKPDQKTGN